VVFDISAAEEVEVYSKLAENSDAAEVGCGIDII